MRKILLVLVVAVLSPISVVRADNFQVFGSRAVQNPTDILDWSQLGMVGAVLATPQTARTFNGNSVLIGNIDGMGFQGVTNGFGWLGNFDYGESLLWNRGARAPFLMKLGSGVGSFGFNIQPLAYGTFRAQVTVFDCGFQTLFSQIFTGTSSNLGNGSALFVGVGDTSGANICAIAISTTDVNANNSFLINDLSFTATTYVGAPATTGP